MPCWLTDSLLIPFQIVNEICYSIIQDNRERVVNVDVVNINTHVHLDMALFIMNRYYFDSVDTHTKSFLS